MKNPKVTVLMSVYNGEKYLQEAIDSILGQTFKDFEFLIINDASTDGTDKILQSYCDPRLKIVYNRKNIGFPKSLNKGIQISRGKYLARMDADDISMHDRIGKQVEFLNRNKDYGMVGSEAILFDGNGDWGYRKAIQIPTKNSFLSGSPFMHPAIMIRKDLLMEVGGYRVSKKTKRTTEDYDLFMRLYSIGMKGYNLSEPLIRYREDNESYKRRKYVHRFNEVRVRYTGFRNLGLIPIGLIYTIKPLIVGLIPQKWLKILRNEKLVPK